MTFVNITLLAGTALVALPIVLHLIMRQRPKLLEFPALRFLQKRHDVNRRRLRLRHILLLLLRAAAIALLAFALARPSVNFSGVLSSQEAPVAAALIFDAAPRMDYRHDNRSRLEAAQPLGQWLLSQFPEQSKIAVLDTRAGSGTFQIDAAAAKGRIERLATVANSRPLTDAVEEALRLLDTSGLAHWEIYIFTDLARASWPKVAVGRLNQRIEELRQGSTKSVDLQVYLIDVGIQEPTNYALGDVRLSGQILSNRSLLKIETQLLRTGPDGQRTVELYMLDENGNEQKQSGQSYTLTSGESQQVSFHKGGLGIGTHQGFLRILGQDGLACDDTRFFTVQVKPAWQILVAAPKPPVDYTLYLTEALAPAMFRKRGRVRFVCRVVALEELAQQPLEDYAAVCLLDPTPLPSATWQKLGDYAAEGHGVAIFLGRNAQPVDKFNATHAQELLPGKLFRQARAPDGDVFLAPRDYQHPILAAFRDAAGAIPWSAFPVYLYWELAEPPAGVAVVLRYSDGRPALLLRSLGEGRVLTMTTPVSDNPNRRPWNLLPVGEAWPFLILVNQIVSYLVGGSDQQLNYFAGQTAVLHLDTRREGTYQLFAPGGLSFPLSADPQRPMLVITSTDQVGNYRVKAGGTAGVDRGFSVNLAPEQTRLDRIPEEELSELLPYRIARTRDQIERDISTRRVGRELFPLLMLLVAIVLAAEHVVANRFYQE